MNKPLTVKQLYKECKKLIDAGKGDNVIMISSDDEGNAYHYLWYSFSTVKSMEEPIIYNGKKYEFPFEFADESIASKDDTIILG